jgi:hypothetical protein
VPAGTSPKIRAVWEQVRHEIVARTDVPPAPKSSPPPPPPRLSPDPTAPPTGTEVARPTNETAGPRVTIPEIALAGGGVLLAGVGVVLGVAAHSTGTLAATDTYQDDATGDLRSAQQQQVAADVLIGVGATAVAVSAALFIQSEWARRSATGGATPANP